MGQAHTCKTIYRTAPGCSFTSFLYTRVLNTATQTRIFLYHEYGCWHILLGWYSYSGKEHYLYQICWASYFELLIKLPYFTSWEWEHSWHMGFLHKVLHPVADLVGKKMELSQNGRFSISSPFKTALCPLQDVAAYTKYTCSLYQCRFRKCNLIWPTVNAKYALYLHWNVLRCLKRKKNICGDQIFLGFVHFVI